MVVVVVMVVEDNVDVVDKVVADRVVGMAGIVVAAVVVAVVVVAVVEVDVVVVGIVEVGIVEVGNVEVAVVDGADRVAEFVVGVVVGYGGVVVVGADGKIVGVVVDLDITAG